MRRVLHRAHVSRVLISMCVQSDADSHLVHNLHMTSSGNPTNPDTREVGHRHCDEMGESIACAVRRMAEGRPADGPLAIASVTIAIPRRKIPDTLLVFLARA